MLKKIASRLFLAVLVMVLGACATPGGTQAGEKTIRSGVIEQIEPAVIQSNHHQGVGAVVGGVGGLAIGSLLGGGTGRDVAMVLGAIGGAVAGNAIQENKDKPVAGQQIIVRTTSGVLVQVTQPLNANVSLFRGQPVFIEGSGENTRVVPQ